jgi:hypothetical protein
VFTTVDPIVTETQQPYDYAGQDPINKYDLDGKCLGIPFSGPCPGSRFVRKLYDKVIEQSAAGLGSVSYGLYFWDFEWRHHVLKKGSTDAPERFFLHGDMYFDRVEHAHGDPRTQFDEHVKTVYLFGLTIHLWFYLPGAHGPPQQPKFDF